MCGSMDRTLGPWWTMSTPPFPLLVHGGQAQGVAAIPLLLSFCSRRRCRRRRAHASARCGESEGKLGYLGCLRGPGDAQRLHWRQGLTTEPAAAQGQRRSSGEVMAAAIGGKEGARASSSSWLGSRNQGESQWLDLVSQGGRRRGKRSMARRWLGLDVGLEGGTEAPGGQLRSRAPSARQSKAVVVYVSARVCPGAE